MDQHIAARAALVATLQPDDVERAAAEQHVASCHDCRAALDEAKWLLTLVKRALGPSPPADRTE
jgi:hypothetical protein